MADSQFKPWSDNPNAPKIWYNLYLLEKINFAGNLIGSVLYGMLAVLFLNCITSLFNPVYRRGERVKWGLVSFTVIMFSLATLQTTIHLNFLSLCYIDNREYPGVEGGFPGPIGYHTAVSLEPINVIPYAAIPMNSWLADGLLLYRCYVVYSMNHWVMAFPCLMYVGSVVVGVLAICLPIVKVQGLADVWPTIPYLSISLSLNIVLTLMIVIRLVLHGKNFRAVTGSRGGISGLYKTIATMLIESSALFAVSSLLVIGSLASKSGLSFLFIPILAQTQVIAPMLIIQRVASRRALTRSIIAPGNSSNFNAGSQGELARGGCTFPGGHPMRFGGEQGTGPSGFGVRVDTVIDIRREKI